jgi:hypothetical protein
MNKIIIEISEPLTPGEIAILRGELLRTARVWLDRRDNRLRREQERATEQQIQEAQTARLWKKP